MVLVELFFGTLLWSSYTNEHKSKRFGVLLVIQVSCCSSFLCFKHYVQQSSFLKFVPIISFFVVALTHPRFYSNCRIIFYRGKFWLNCIQPSCKSTCSQLDYNHNSLLGMHYFHLVGLMEKKRTESLFSPHSKFLLQTLQKLEGSLPHASTPILIASIAKTFFFKACQIPTMRLYIYAHLSFHTY